MGSLSRTQGQLRSRYRPDPTMLCFESARDLAGFCLGMASIGCWVVAQLPQIVSNIRTRNVEALSPWFLAEWLLVSTFPVAAQCPLTACFP